MILTDFLEHKNSEEDISITKEVTLITGIMLAGKMMQKKFLFFFFNLYFVI